MLRATPQFSSALPRPAFGSCQIHLADTYLMGRRRRCSRKRTRTPSGVCSADRNIRAAPAHIMIDGQSSQRYVPAAPPSGLAFTACQVQHARATVELTRHPCQLAAHFLPCARPPDICWPLPYRPRCHPGTHSRQSHRAFVTTRAGFDQDTCIRRAESYGGLLATSFGGLQHFHGAHILYG